MLHVYSFSFFFCGFLFWIRVISNTEKYRVKHLWTIYETRKFCGNQIFIRGIHQICSYNILSKISHTISCLNMGLISNKEKFRVKHSWTIYETRNFCGNRIFIRGIQQICSYNTFSKILHTISCLNIGLILNGIFSDIFLE